MSSKVGLKNKSHFLVWKGVRGSSPRKILKTKKAEEAISGHFEGAILPSVSEEFQRMLLPFILYAILKYRLRKICIYLHKSLLCVDITVQI